MRAGHNLVVNVDTMVPQLKENYDIPSILPLKDFIFKRSTFLSETSNPNYMKIVKPHENKDLLDDLIHKMFWQQELIKIDKLIHE